MDTSPEAVTSMSRSINALVVACGLSTVAYAVAANTIEPCAVISAEYDRQIAVDPIYQPIFEASIAHDCLLSVPLGKQAAIELVDSIEPYLDWQSTSPYLADPPADYSHPALDIFANLAAVRAKLENDTYSGEYEFQQDLYKTVFLHAHDGHFTYLPDLFTQVFQWIRKLPLVSISEDQSSLPQIKVYYDVISSPSTASAVTLINGIDAAKFLEDLATPNSIPHDPDAAYNSMFLQRSTLAVSRNAGNFQGGGGVGMMYQGPSTNITFANGTEITLKNYAGAMNPLTGFTNGASMYEVFCNPNGYKPGGAPGTGTDTSATNGTSSANPKPISGYPSPVIRTTDATIAGYFLDGEGYEDVAVISVFSFYGKVQALPEAQDVTAKFLAEAAAAGKTKLVVDLQRNPGGWVYMGYDFFRQLFPSTQEDGFTRARASEPLLAMSHFISDLVANFDPYTSDDWQSIVLYKLDLNYRFDLNLSLEPFLTFEDKFGPVAYKGSNYTEIRRFDFNDTLSTVNETFGFGVEISGYGSRANLTQFFAAENIILLYDGLCASTCALASEEMRHRGGVKSVAMGGRPKKGPIQAIGYTKGAVALQWSVIYELSQYALQVGANITSDEQKATLARYNNLAINRSAVTTVNSWDHILRDNLQDGLPAQFVVEHADCRLYWTLPMVKNITAVWKATADSAWNGAACAYGSLPTSAPSSPKTEARQPAASVARAPGPNRHPPASLGKWRSMREPVVMMEQLLPNFIPRFVPSP